MRIPEVILLLAALCAAACVDGKDGTAIADVPDAARAAISVAGVQGAGDVSPLAHRTVTVEGIVSGDFQEGDGDDLNKLGGFFLQSEYPDADAGSSDGVFIFEGSAATVDVNVGDKVAVTGTVQEYFGETQIKATGISILGSGEIRPSDIELPVAGLASNSDGEFIADLERYEGMLVRFPQTLTISGLHHLERYGAIRLSEGGRLYQFTNLNAPDTRLYTAHRRSSAARSIILDDGRRESYAWPIRYLDTAATLRVGDTVTGLTGNLRYSRGSGNSGDEAWRLMPTSDPVFVITNPRPGAPEAEGMLRVASFNVLNYFSTVDNGEAGCGPAADNNCRGADSAAEQKRQLGKIAAALAMIDADIVGLIELENNASASLADIAGALNASAGPGTYTFLVTGTVGDDAIKTGFLYRRAAVRPIGAFAILHTGVDRRFNDNRNRPALAQTFAAAQTGGRFTVVLNHLKSKGSTCESDGDANTGDGQGNCNRTRTDAAKALVDWLASDPTSSGDPDYLVIGDLNAHLVEDPLGVFEDAGFVNLVDAVSGRGAYSFVYDGQAGALDHAVASQSLVPQVRAAVEWRINADESPVHDYNLENGRDPGIFDITSPFRSSDHDPIIIGLDIN